MTLILCFDNGLAECQLCGGWLYAADVPEGEEPIGGRYCSYECHDEAVRLGWA